LLINAKKNEGEDEIDLGLITSSTQEIKELKRTIELDEQVKICYYSKAKSATVNRFKLAEKIIQSMLNVLKHKL
jgi:hypothetical protein